MHHKALLVFPHARKETGSNLNCTIGSETTQINKYNSQDNSNLNVEIVSNKSSSNIDIISNVPVNNNDRSFLISKNSFNIVHVNIQSLSNKLLDLELLCDDFNSAIDVIYIDEHWLEEVQLSSIYLKNFKIANFYCRSS